MSIRYYTASAGFTAVVDITCELCAGQYTLKHEYYFRTPFSGLLSPLAAKEYVQEHMQPALEGVRAGKTEYLPVKRCPLCGYLQSWMIGEAKKGRDQLLVSMILMVPMVVLLVLGYFIGEAPANSSQENSLLIAALGVGVMLVVALVVWSRVLRKAYNPNRKILSGREAPARANAPVIRIEPHPLLK